MFRKQKTDTWAEAYTDRMVSLLWDWINASETGRDPRTGRRAHWKDQNQHWWDLYTLATDVEDWLRTRQGPELRQA